MCTRAVYLGLEAPVITTRTMDWFAPMGTNLWVYPRALQRDGAAGPDSLRWTSRYGSVTVAGFDAATVDGVNEAGLAANILYLSVPLGITTPGQPNISSILWRTVADLDFSPAAPTSKLTLNEASALMEAGTYVSGNAAAWLRPAAPFAFVPAPA